jgi:hypothetical protein
LTEDPPLEIAREEFLEVAVAADEFEEFLNAEDHHGYFQAGLRYRFTQGERMASALRYDNLPGEVCVHLPTAAAFIPYYDPFLAVVVQHLREELPTHRIRLLCRNGYRDIDVKRLLTHQGPFWHFVGRFWDDPRRWLILFALIFLTALLRAVIAAFSG